jgi:hypothetical protein
MTIFVYLSGPSAQHVDIKRVRTLQSALKDNASAAQFLFQPAVKEVQLRIPRLKSYY